VSTATIATNVRIIATNTAQLLMILYLNSELLNDATNIQIPSPIIVMQKTVTTINNLKN